MSDVEERPIRPVGSVVNWDVRDIEEPRDEPELAHGLAPTLPVRVVEGRSIGSYEVETAKSLLRDMQIPLMAHPLVDSFKRFYEQAEKQLVEEQKTEPRPAGSGFTGLRKMLENREVDVSNTVRVDVGGTDVDVSGLDAKEQSVIKAVEQMERQPINLAEALESFQKASAKAHLNLAFATKAEEQTNE